MLFSALRALLIEANSGMYGTTEDAAALKKLDDHLNDVGFIKEQYGLSKDLGDRLSLLYDVRNEIVHPSHRPAGTPHNTPASMLRLRELGALQSTNRTDCDYNWMDGSIAIPSVVCLRI